MILQDPYSLGMVVARIALVIASTNKSRLLQELTRRVNSHSVLYQRYSQSVNKYIVKYVWETKSDVGIDSSKCKSKLPHNYQ